MPIKAILFDLDMTLVDSSAVEEYRDAGLWEQVKEEFSRIRPFEIVKGVSPHEMPEELRDSGLKIGIVTNSRQSYAEQVLKTFKIKYDTLVSYRDTEEHKPDAEPILLALNRLGVEADEAVHVGDDLLDTEACYHAGVFSFGAGWSLNGTSSSSFMQQAPEVTIWRPAWLRRIKSRSKLRYIGEAIQEADEFESHNGSTLWWKHGKRLVRCLGRYMKTEDPRHPTHDWTKVLLQNKNDDTHSELLGRVLAEHLNGPKHGAVALVSVPPKPNQRNRFTELMKVCRPLLNDNINLYDNGLKCLKDIDGYKSMGYYERRQALRGAFKSMRRWSGTVILLDDVYTTGAVSEECERILLRSGAETVRTVTFGLTQKSMEVKYCELCQSKMKVQRRRSDGNRFWGCSAYFSTGCRFKIPID